MLGSEFENFFENFLELKKFFLGVFSIDTLPKRIKLKYFCICNTSPSQSEGEHWFCLLKIGHNHLELFDSLGVTDQKQQFYRENLRLPDKYLTFNETQFQPNSSQNCGLFCLYFIFQRLHNLDLTFDEVLEEFFDVLPSINDETVMKFCNEVLQWTT
jgi:hypothetical protein